MYPLLYQSMEGSEFMNRGPGQDFMLKIEVFAWNGIFLGIIKNTFVSSNIEFD